MHKGWSIGKYKKCIKVILVLINIFFRATWKLWLWWYTFLKYFLDVEGELDPSTLAIKLFAHTRKNSIIPKHNSVAFD